MNSRFRALALISLLVVTLGPQAGARTCVSLFARTAEHAPWFTQITLHDVEKVLGTTKVVKVTSLREALRESRRRTFGSTPGMLVITFADGTEALWKAGTSGRVEAAAYGAARMVGSSLVPPTVYRTFNESSFSESVSIAAKSSLIGNSGSLQLFVRTPKDLTQILAPERQLIWSRVSSEQKAERDIYNFVFGNWDLHWGNILIDASFSIVQIDNGVIRSRQQVRYGELPFVRRMSLDTVAGINLPNELSPEFPFAEATYLANPSVLEFITFMHAKAAPKDLANYVRGRLKDTEIPITVLDELATLIRNRAHISTIRKFLSEHTEVTFSKDHTMRVIFWDREIWIQGIGFQNYQPIIPPVFPKRVVENYRRLSFDDLRSVFPEDLFSDITLTEMLGRRDQIVAASDAIQKSAGD